ncbi:MAG: serine/threonine-protein kinase [Myxococcota bacterium]
MSATESGYQLRPTLFGQYCLLERISVGGMAEVFRARPFHAPDADKYLALKRILPHLAEDEDCLKMFEDEAKLGVHLRHPNVVRVFELGRFQSSPYILMEFISGQDLLALQKRLRREGLIMSVAQACYIVKELAKGLDYAHKAVDDKGQPLHVIHRDVSPQNIFIAYHGAVKLIDFGVAKASVQSTKTRVGVLKGKFGYMSPEQIRGEQIDHRSDIFACGTVLWELLTNRRLFTGESELEVFHKVKEARVERPSQKNVEVPDCVDEIVMKALSPQPPSRYQTCGELVRDLQAFLSSTCPLYTQAHLLQWMRRFFGEELEEVELKVERFRQIRTPEDVRRAVFSGAGVSDPSADGAAEGATRIWDAEIEPEQDQDLDAFIAQHTVVQAGGFDLEEFTTFVDAGVPSLEEVL